MSSGFLARLGAALATTIALALSLGSCGGKSGDTYTGSGGSGGSSGTKPGSGGSKSTGGTSSSGGSGGMGCNGCPAIGCGPGTYSVLLPGDCCPTCVMDCRNIGCPAIQCQNGSYIPQGECCPVCGPSIDCSLIDCDDVVCPDGSHAEVPAGECCPQCVSDLTCEEGRAGWQALFDARTEDLDAFGCSVNEDCTVTILGSLCKFDCGTAVNTASAELLALELNAYGAVNCASCPVTDVACPAVEYFAECVTGQCVLRP